MFNPWKLFNEQPEWNQFKKKDWKKNKGFTENKSPVSRRFLTPEGDERGSIGPNQPEVNGLRLDKQNKDSEIEVSVNSTAIASYRYDPETKDLYITYTTGDTEYTFPNVPADYVKALDMAPSKGRYVEFVIKPQFSINRR